MYENIRVPPGLPLYVGFIIESGFLSIVLCVFFQFGNNLTEEERAGGFTFQLQQNLGNFNSNFSKYSHFRNKFGHAWPVQ